MMTTPAPEKTTGRRRSARHHKPKPRLRLGYTAWLISWLAPTLVMGVILLSLALVPGWDTEFLAPLIPLIGGAAVVIGLPGTLFVTWLLRHHTNPVVHVLGYVVVGLLYGPVVLLEGAGGLVPMLIPIVGFPAGVLLGLARWAVQPMAQVLEPEG
ncbi:hypothetical protein [Nesterenkonia alba]|uniref:hypothetical protein n=1 Tax=Nesterenkonia alba TaxID=515814 RepID=UPI0003B4523E|nr:hypothetical protein [Nesterenkonia alba]